MGRTVLINLYHCLFLTVDGMFEGDIEVTPEQMERLQKGTNEFGSIIGKRWPNGRIPYKIESSIGKFHYFFSCDSIIFFTECHCKGSVIQEL